MSKLIFDADAVFNFLKGRGVDLVYSAGMQGIGNERDGDLIGGVLYDGYTGNNIFMHVAGLDGVNWVNRNFVKAAFGYPFKQLNCNRISGWVDASNQKARRLDEHLGFKQEAVLEGVARDGGDVIIYRMWKHECRFI
jgi:RimJ/RimL family protein N-acetyltransferase